MEQEKKWVETRKDCDVDEAGNLIVRRATLELEKKKTFGFERKEIIDLALRLVGLLAIGIPVWLFYSQQNAERNKQRALLQIEAYTNVSVLLHELLENEDLNRKYFESKRLAAFHQHVPQLNLYVNGDSLDKTLDDINFNLKSYALSREAWKLSDSIENVLLEMWRPGIQKSRVMELRNQSDKLLPEVENFLTEAYDKGIRFDSTVPEGDKIIGGLRGAADALNGTMTSFAALISFTKEPVVYPLQIKSTHDSTSEFLKLCNNAHDNLFQLSRSKNQLGEDLRTHLKYLKGKVRVLDSMFVESNRYLSE